MALFQRKPCFYSFIMSAESISEHSPINLWTFIRNSKAGQVAPLKVLQGFILSLDQQCLSHMITVYLQSLIEQSMNKQGLTTKQSMKKLIHSNNPNALNPHDVTILNKTHKHYGQKYHKKVIRKWSKIRTKTDIFWLWTRRFWCSRFNIYRSRIYAESSQCQ